MANIEAVNANAKVVVVNKNLFRMENKIVPPAESLSQNARRKFLNMAVSSMLLHMGFDSIEKQCLETLCEMFQSLIYEIGLSSRSYCELAGRTDPVVGDVVMALCNMGLSMKNLELFRRKIATVPPIPAPQQMAAPKQNSLLKAGTKQELPSYVPSHFPALPDPHAYIRTPTHKQLVTEYEAIREKAASQKRDVERALTKFLCKTSETHSLFPDADEANQMFPLIACKPAYPAYLAALNPTDQVFDFEELEYHYQVANRTEDAPADKDMDDDDDEGHDESKEMESKSQEAAKQEEDAVGGSQQDAAAMMDNPFLKAIVG